MAQPAQEDRAERREFTDEIDRSTASGTRRPQYALETVRNSVEFSAHSRIESWSGEDRIV